MSFQATHWAIHEVHGVPNKLVLVVMAEYADENGECFPSQDRLARDTDLSVSTVRRTIRTYEALGLMTSIKRYVMSEDGSKVRTSNLYRLAIGAQPAATTTSEPVDSPPQDLPVNLTGRGEPVDNSATGQSDRKGVPTGQIEGGYRSQVTGISTPKHQIEPPNRTEPNQVSEGPRESAPARSGSVAPVRDAAAPAPGPVRFGSDRPHGESGPGADAPDVQPAFMPVAGLDEADAALVLACLPAWMHPMDAPGARHVAGMLRERVEAGWEPEQIREALSAQPPRSVGRLSKLVEYRIKMNVLVALAPRRAAVVSLQQRRNAETSRAERAKARSEALAQQSRRDEEADRRWSEAMEQARVQMPGASHLEVAQAAHRMLTTPSPDTGAHLKGGGKPTQPPPVKAVSATAYDAK